MNPPQPLALVRSPHTDADVSAGWLPSADPMEWLAEIAHARRHGCELALYPVAASVSDPRAAGVFLIPRRGKTSFRPRVIPLVEILPGVHVPSGAGLSAGLLANERAFFFPYPLHFHHPSLGLVGFEAKDELSPAVLLEVRARTNGSWNWAVPAPVPHPPFVGLRVEVPMDDPAEMLAEGAGEIGADAGKRLPGIGVFASAMTGFGDGLLRVFGWFLEKIPGVKGAQDAPGPVASGWFAGILKWLLILSVVALLIAGLSLLVGSGGSVLDGLFPTLLLLIILSRLLTKIGLPGINLPGRSSSGRPSGRGMQGKGGSKKPGSLQEWAKRNLDRIQAHRNREIERLMKLMETNPEEGLRYALPLTGSAGRGTAPLSWSLGRNTLNYTYQTGGNGARDQWELDAQSRLQLEKKYREAALREIALGRHERAAYILSKLVGDWNGAAQALAQGGRHHDAVAIYLQKLNNKHAAAKCLEEGGLLAQAADLYIELKSFEKAGELHARLGNDAEARRLWLLAVEAQRDPFEKARIYDQRLKEPDAALALLESLWKAGSHASRALQSSFTIFSEQSRDHHALDLAGRMFRESPPSTSLTELTKVGLEELERRSGDGAFRSALEAEVYPRMAGALMAGTPNHAALLSLLTRFEPTDRLLARDTKRYSIPRSKIESPARKRMSGRTAPTQIIKIPMEAKWQSLAELRGGVSIAGHANGILAVAQFRDGQCHTSPLMTRDKVEANDIVRHLGIISARNHGRLFHLPRKGTLHYRALDRARTPADEKIGDLQQILAAGPHGSRDEYMLLEHTATGSLCVHVYSEAGSLLRSVPIDFAPPEVAGLDWHCAGRDGHWCFTAEGFFAWRHPNGEFSTMQMDEHPCGLLLPPGHLPLAALLPHKQHVLMALPGKPGGPLETVYLSPLEDAVACFTNDGQIVVATEGEGVVFASDNYSDAVETLALPTAAGRPIAASSFGPDGFVFLTSTGNLLIFS
ncbi:MAG: hypothetical protein QM755_08295 [Luteolibacter sp.]